MGVRDVDENNLSHHFLEGVSAYPQLVGSGGAGAGSQLCQDLTKHRGGVP